MSCIFLACYLFCFLCFSESVKASGLGKCPNYPSMPKFNMSQFLGHWNEIERSFYLPEIPSGCTTLEFNRIDELEELDEIKRRRDAGDIEVNIKLLNKWTGNPWTSTGYASRNDEKSSIMNFQLRTGLPSVVARFLPGSGKYQILFTDFVNFAILYSCSNFGFAFNDQIWVLGRQRDIDVKLRKTIYDILTELGLESNRLIASDYNCPGN